MDTALVKIDDEPDTWANEIRMTASSASRKWLLQLGLGSRKWLLQLGLVQENGFLHHRHK